MIYTNIICIIQINSLITVPGILFMDIPTKPNTNEHKIDEKNNPRPKLTLWEKIVKFFKELINQ